MIVPEADLIRQKEFEKKIKEMFAEREAHPVACVDTFGCQQNVADGQKLMVCCWSAASLSRTSPWRRIW